MTITVTLPESPLDSVRRLAADRDTQVWPVGGVVRDALLGRPIHDWDFAVGRDAAGLAQAVADALSGAYYALDSERGTGRVVLAPQDARQVVLDFAELREADLEADLHARDFTINAMATAPDGQLIDPLGGLADLQARLIRAVRPTAFDDDPLRMLRAVRLVAELGLRLEANTAAWIGQRAAMVARTSPERVRDEIMRVLAAPAAADHLHLLDELGLLAQVLPEVEPLKLQAQSPPHRFDAWWHTLLTVEAVQATIDEVGSAGGAHLAYLEVPQQVWTDVRGRLGRFSVNLADHLAVRLKGGHTRRTLLTLAALCHDLGKPITCTEDERGRLHFYGHERAGARITARRMRALRMSEAEVEHTRAIVQAHLRPGHLARLQGPVTRRAVYRYFRGSGSAGVEAALLSLADHMATWGPHLERDRWLRQVEVSELLLSHYFEHPEQAVSPRPLVTGSDLMRHLRIGEGPQVGRLLGAVREAQAAGEVNTREEALDLARRLLRE